MMIDCTERELFIFKKISRSAKEMGVSCYVIGGFVRDKLIGRNTKDADVVCVGDGIALAHKVAEHFQPKPVVSY
ncbi:MAG: tRNA nucleotidyltransferase, partial [Bacteroidetes bacterium]|nr:tRNA nucleotidyltransferase [Bacteroidota bacterium]